MARDRDLTLAGLTDAPQVQALVIGGGINGISVFRELALQGLRVLLIDRGDFCGACSSAPSRMIHGGLRYLENGEFALVRESLAERDALLRNAPHMVFPLATTVPIRKRFSGLLNGAINFVGLKGRPAERGSLAIRAGLTLYDLYTRSRRALPGSRFRGKAETHRLWPGLQPELRFSATYYDAWISHPERLGIELIADSIPTNENAMVLNHAEVGREADGTLTLTDRLTGATLPVRPEIIVNATGAWVDQTNLRLFPAGGDAPDRFVGGTKGSHLILDHPELHAALSGHMIYFENVDGRVCILFPYLGRVLIGSTDIRVDEPGEVRCEDAEVDYILKSLANVFPGITVRPEQIVYRFAGVRPLPRSDKAFTGRISRDHATRNLGGDPPVLCMIGGKWTTFRAFGEQCADMALEVLGRPRIIDTRDRPIGGGAGFPGDAAGVRDLVADLARSFGVDRDRAAHAVSHYGMRAEEILRACKEAGDDEPLEDGTAYTVAELRHLIRTEHVGGLDDLMLRRTSLAITGALSMAMIERASDLLAGELKWSATQADAAKRAFLDLLKTRHGLDAETLQNRNAKGNGECGSVARHA